MGIIMATIHTVLFGTLKAKRTLEIQVMGSRIGPLLLDQIERDVRQVFAYNLAHGAIFRGEDERLSGLDADHFTLVAQTPSTSALFEDDKAVFSSVNEIGYAVTRNVDNADFLVLWRREDFYVDDEPLKGGKGTPLYRRVTGFDVKYYATTGEEADDEVEDDWSSEDRKTLPAAMEITLSLEVEPRPTGMKLSAEDLERRTYTFRRWVTFPSDTRYTMAVRPAIPYPADDGPGGPQNPNKPKGDGDDGDGGGNGGAGPGMGGTGGNISSSGGGAVGSGGGGGAAGGKGSAGGSSKGGG